MGSENITEITYNCKSLIETSLNDVKGEYGLFFTKVFFNGDDEDVEIDNMENAPSILASILCDDAELSILRNININIYQQGKIKTLNTIDII